MEDIKDNLVPLFVEFPKIARFSREVIVTEKIDGTNAQILIGEDGTFLTGSRTRWITPDNDNHGFARWAYGNKEELITFLGPGRHYGEWWGNGIQRGYGLPNGDKRFSLFNILRWKDPLQLLPGLLQVVPVLWRGNFEDLNVIEIMEELKAHGSYVAPFMNPEGIVIYHTASRTGFKKTFENDNVPKSLVNKKCIILQRGGAVGWLSV